MDAKSQIVEKIRSSGNILVTVSAETTVDQIAACIGLTLLLTKYKKNATAVFSGQVPAVLNFLHPKDTLAHSTDSLRDFIIALDKSKADKLRYKVEDDVVKIFITPYKTALTSRDLKYSAGDFNVDVILALGAHHQQDLDKAITAHGRIFHDAVVMSINNTPNGDLGVANWEDLEASSLSELIAQLADELDTSLLDSEISTALLTGIVAETSRFSNHRTHPQTLTISSRLLEAGADQHLVNEQLQDLIGTVVGLEAGAEIKPTKDTSHEPLHHDEPEELVLGADGSLQPDKPAAGNTAADKTPIPAPATQPDKSPEQPPVTPPVIPQPAGDDAGPSALPSIDPDLADITLPAASDEDAVTARQAVDSALGAEQVAPEMPVVPEAAAGPTSLEELLRQADTDAGLRSQPAPGPAAAPGDMPAVQPLSPPETPPSPTPSGPMIRPIAPNQPSYTNPDTMTQYEMPANPAHEPAPLGMSPADQAFTMPLPPTPDPGAPGASPQSAPAGPPGGQQPPSGATTPPPPLPPPMMPPGFGGPAA